MAATTPLHRTMLHTFSPLCKGCVSFSGELLPLHPPHSADQLTTCARMLPAFQAAALFVSASERFTSLFIFITCTVPALQHKPTRVFLEKLRANSTEWEADGRVLRLKSYLGISAPPRSH